MGVLMLLMMCCVGDDDDVCDEDDVAGDVGAAGDGHPSSADPIQPFCAEWVRHGSIPASNRILGALPSLQLPIGAGAYRYSFSRPRALVHTVEPYGESASGCARRRRHLQPHPAPAMDRIVGAIASLQGPRLHP